MEEKDPFTQMVIGAAIEVHREMGPGLLESVYQACMEQELRSRGIEFDPQCHWPLVYKGVKLDDFFIIDLYFPGRLVVELKSVEKLIPIFDAQLLTYLKLTRTRVGLLVNFNVPCLIQGVKRMVL